MVKTSWTEDFNGVSLPSGWTARTDGNGTVSVSGGEVLIDPGGAASDDIAAIVYNTPLDFTKDWHLVVKCRLLGPTFPQPASTDKPAIFSIIDSTGIPNTGTRSVIDDKMRMQFRNVLHDTNFNGGVDFRYQNTTSGDVWWTENSPWTTTYPNESAEGLEPDSEGWLIFKNNADSGVRWIHVGMKANQGENRNNPCGFVINQDSDWRVFGTDIRSISNSGYLVIGELSNGGTKHDTSIEVLQAHYGELDGSDEEFMFVNSSDDETTNYDCYRLECGTPDTYPLWLSTARFDDSIEISRGGADRVKDPIITKHTDGFYYLWSHINNGFNSGLINVRRSATTGLPGVGDWGSPVDVVRSDDITNIDDIAFPHPIFHDNRWVVFYGGQVVSPGNTFQIRRIENSNTNPTSGTWSNETLVLQGSGTPGWNDSGYGQPWLIKWNDSKYYMAATAYDFSLNEWSVAFFESTGIFATGSAQWTIIDGENQPYVNPKEGSLTTLDGNALQTRVFNVIDATGFSVGDPIFIDTTHPGHNRIEAISGNQLTVAVKIAHLSGRTVAHPHRESFACRFIRKRSDGVWMMFGTAFKTVGGDEDSFVLYNDNANPTTDNWTIQDPAAVSGHFLFPNIPRYWPIGGSLNTSSNENPAGIFDSVLTSMEGANFFEIRAAPTEFLLTIRATHNTSIESLTELSNAYKLAIELLETVGPTNKISIETLQGVLLSANLPIEFQGGTTLSLLKDLPLEYLSEFVDLNQLPIEFLRDIEDVSVTLPIETLLSISDLNKLSTEIIGELVNLNKIPIESLLNLLVFDKLSVEQLKDVANFLNISVEQLLTIRDFNDVPIAYGGAAVSSFQRSLPIEILAEILNIEDFNLESIAPIADLNRLPVEHLSDVGLEVKLPLLSLLSLLGLEKLPLEYILALQLNQNNPVESLTELEGILVKPIESLLDVSSLDEVQVEYGGAAVFSVSRFLPIEIIGILQENRALPVENLSQLAITRDVAIQALLDLQPFNFKTSIEFLEGLSSQALVPVEFAGSEITTKLLKWVLLNRKTLWTLSEC